MDRALIGLLAVAAAGAVWALEPANVLCEWQATPSAMADPCPEFYWEAPGQTAYQVQVAGSAEGLGAPDLWDSGRVKTNLPIAEYEGRPLESGRTYFWRLRVWDADGRAGQWSPVRQFTTKFGPLPGRLAHIRTFLNFGSRPETIAKLYDLSFRKEVKDHNPRVRAVNYSLLATMVIPSDKAKRLAEFCVQQGLTKEGILEDMFLHFREDHNVTLHVGAERAGNPRETRRCPGWDPANDRNGDGIVDDREAKNLVNPQATGRRKQDCRVPIYFWGPPRDDFVMYVGHPEYQRYLAQVYVQDRLEGFDGLFIDTTPAHIPGPGGGGEILEYPTEQRSQWLRDMQVMLAKVKIAIGDKLLSANGWHAKPFVIDGTEWENWLNIAAPLSRVEPRLKAVADLDRRGAFQMVQYNPVYDPEFGEFGVKADVPVEQDRMYGLGLYYLVHGNYTYFGIGQHPYRKSEQKWFPAIERDIGRPTGPYKVWAESGETLPTAGNLLKNGGFEQADADGNPADWVAAEPVAIDPQVKRGGRSSVRVDAADPTINNINKQYVTLKPNTFYTLSGWIRTENLAGGQGAQIYPYEFEGAQGGGINIVVHGTTDWKLYSTVFKTGEDPEGRINFRVYQSTGRAWFDDLSLVEGAYYAWKVLGREFTRGLVLVKPTPGGGDYGEQTESVHDLGGTYRRLKMDGTLGPPITRVRLRHGEAAILVK